VEATKTVDQFVAEATREAIRGTASAQDALRHYLDELTEIAHTYFTVWNATAQAGMRATFDLQNAWVQAGKTMLDTTTQAGHAMLDQWASSLQQQQTATTNLVAANGRLVEASLPSRQG
jgi:hypothetical protein